MLASGHREDDGSKGGNNVASLLMRALSNLGWLQHNTYGKRLSIIMENYSGQNKNKHVIQLALFLVEVGFFHEVELIFMSVGTLKMFVTDDSTFLNFDTGGAMFIP